MRDGASKNKKGQILSNKMSVMIVISSPPPSPHQVFRHVKWVVSNFYLTVNTVAFWPTPMLNWYQYQFRELTSSNSSLLWWFAYVTIKSDTSCTFQGGRVSSAIEFFNEILSLLPDHITLKFLHSPPPPPPPPPPSSLSWCTFIS